MPKKRANSNKTSTKISSQSKRSSSIKTRTKSQIREGAPKVFSSRKGLLKKKRQLSMAHQSPSLLHAARIKSNQRISQPTSAASKTEQNTNHANHSDLPFSYNITKLVLMARDPYWIFCYWDFSHDTWNWTQDICRSKAGYIRGILRVYDVTDLKFNGLNANNFFDLDVSLEARNWYVHVNGANREWIFDLALVDSDGKFYLIARSNRVKTPRDTPSDVIDEEWMISDFDEIYALSGGFGRGLSSGEIRQLIASRYLMQKMVFSSFTNQPKNS